MITQTLADAILHELHMCMGTLSEDVLLLFVHSVHGDLAFSMRDWDDSLSSLERQGLIFERDDKEYRTHFYLTGTEVLVCEREIFEFLGHQTKVWREGL